jgi:hypothetical protein
MDTLLNIAPQLAIAVFMFYVFRWMVKHFDPYVARLLDSIDDIRETGQRMADIGERLVKIVETQQEWQEQLDAVLLDRHKRIMERLDSIDSAYVRILYQMQECPQKKETQ